jgi:hypothetical protein
VASPRSPLQCKSPRTQAETSRAKIGSAGLRERVPEIQTKPHPLRPESLIQLENPPWPGFCYTAAGRRRRSGAPGPRRRIGERLELVLQRRRERTQLGYLLGVDGHGDRQ